MAYVDPNYQTKRAFLEAVKAGIEHKPYNPLGTFPEPTDGRIVVEGPHYPKPHRWYASCVVAGGVIVSAK